MNGTSGAMGLGGGLWMIVEIAVGLAIVLALLWLFTAGLHGQWSASDEAVRLLTARFARGEISAAEYERARCLLVSAAPSTKGTHR